MSAELETRLERVLAPRREPGTEVEARLRAAVMAALPPAGRRARRGLAAWRDLRRRGGLRRRIGPLVVAGALVIGGGALAAALLAPGPSGDGRRANLPSAEAGARFAANPVLAGAPWLWGPPLVIGQVQPRPSLVFPPGVTYGQALQAFYDAVSRRGELPSGARLGPPLPAGKVLSLPTGKTRGVAIDLRAPFGYQIPSGAVVSPVLGRVQNPVFPSRDRVGTPLTVGAQVIAPDLHTCQVIRPGTPGPPCHLYALPPGARATGGVTVVPSVVGLPLPVALERLRRAKLGRALAETGWVGGATRRAIDAAAAAAERLQNPAAAPDIRVTLSDFRRHGFDLFTGENGPAINVLLDPGQEGRPGTALAQYPPPGARVPTGTLAGVAVADDCIGTPVDLRLLCLPGAPTARLRSPALADPPAWLRGRPPSIVVARPRPSLVFPAETSYPEALRALLVWVQARGQLPPGVRLGPPLPRGIVVSLPAGRERGPVLDLGAAFGYSLPKGLILKPDLRWMNQVFQGQLDRMVAAGEAVLLPAIFRAQYLAVPRLLACQIARPGRPTQPCPLEP